MKQYKFKANSSLSFALTHRGRQMYVNFSAAYRGVAMYITTDEALAEKIRAHRWFRQGRIKETVEDMETDNHPAPTEEKPKVVTPISEIPTVKTIANSGNTHGFPAGEVTSFLEAKEFFVTNYGVSKQECASKEAIAQLCVRFGVSFENYEVI